MNKKGKHVRNEEARLRRRWIMECYLVKLLKTHKVRHIKDVIGDTQRYASRYFHPDAKEVKRAIENMQKRLYLKVRDGGIVHYLA
jgi:hypothetical protein